MDTFYCMAENGIKPPKYKWDNYQAAVNEAIRLRERLNCKVYVLKVVAIAEFKEVPVTKLVPVLTKLDHGLENDLPF